MYLTSLRIHNYREVSSWWKLAAEHTRRAGETDWFITSVRVNFVVKSNDLGESLSRNMLKTGHQRRERYSSVRSFKIMVSPRPSTINRVSGINCLRISTVFNVIFRLSELEFASSSPLALIRRIACFLNSRFFFN